MARGGGPSQPECDCLLLQAYALNHPRSSGHGSHVPPNMRAVQGTPCRLDRHMQPCYETLHAALLRPEPASPSMRSLATQPFTSGRFCGRQGSSNGWPAQVRTVQAASQGLPPTGDAACTCGRTAQAHQQRSFRHHLIPTATHLPPLQRVLAAELHTPSSTPTASQTAQQQRPPAAAAACRCGRTAQSPRAWPAWSRPGRPPAWSRPRCTQTWQTPSPPSEAAVGANRRGLEGGCTAGLPAWRNVTLTSALSAHGCCTLDGCHGCSRRTAAAQSGSAPRRTAAAHVEASAAPTPHLLAQQRATAALHHIQVGVHLRDKPEKRQRGCLTMAALKIPGALHHIQVGVRPLAVEQQQTSHFKFPAAGSVPAGASQR